jgi:hypothetical protein
MGQIFYDMGLLSTKEYFECSASDLVAQFVGQTGPKTVSVLKKGLGKVLFIDEAYRLGEGAFGKEAIDELVDNLTKPQFFGKLVVILAGYGDKMNSLLRVNPGLASRFSEEIEFYNMAPGECFALIRQQLRDAGVEFVPQEGSHSDSPTNIHMRFRQLAGLPSWGNGRDVIALSKAIIGAAFENAEPDAKRLEVSDDDVLAALDTMYAQQKVRCEPETNFSTSQPMAEGTIPKLFDFLTNHAPPAQTPTIAAPLTVTAAKKAESTPALADNTLTLETQNVSEEITKEIERDDGVTTEIWDQLQTDIRANEVAEKRSQDAIADLDQQVKSASRAEQASQQEVMALERNDEGGSSGDDDEETNEQRRRQEEARIRAVTACRARQEAEEKLRKEREEGERKRKEEAKVQRKLKDMGVCIMGFRWIKQPSGYRCAGGSHFVSNEELGV